MSNQAVSESTCPSRGQCSRWLLDCSSLRRPVAGVPASSEYWWDKRAQLRDLRPFAVFAVGVPWSANTSWLRSWRVNVAT